MPDDLATTDYTKSSVTFDNTITPLADEQPMEWAEAVEFLTQRFALPSVTKDTGFWGDFKTGVGGPLGALGIVGGDSESTPDIRNLMFRLVQTLPPEMLTEHVLTYTDFRALLDEVAITEAEAARSRKVHYVGDILFTPEERVLASQILAAQSQAEEDTYTILAGAQPELDTQAKRDQWVIEQTNKYKTTGELGAVAELVLDAQDTELPLAQRDEIQQQAATLSLQDQLLAQGNLIETTGTAHQYFSQDDIQRMFRMNMVEWNSIMEDEAYKADARNAGEQGVPSDINVDSGGLFDLGRQATSVDTSSLQGIDAASRGEHRASTNVRLLDVFNSIYSEDRKPAEIRNLQDKLIAGGYLDEDDIRFWGSKNDDATVAAWRTLIRDSVNVGKDMQSILKEQTQLKRADEEEEALLSQRDIVLTSGTGIQTTADVLARQVLGRKLDKEQSARLVEFIHGLEMDSELALDPEGRQITEAVDIDAEVNQWIEGENSTEAGAYDLLEQFQTFNNFVREPG